MRSNSMEVTMFLLGNVTLPVLIALGIFVATGVVTWVAFDWYWTSHRTDADAQAHFGHATWNRRRLWVIGLAVGVSLYLLLLLK